MLNWLRRWQANRRRAIFRYFDGQRQRGIDPLAATRAFHQHPTFNLERHLPGLDEGDAESIELTVKAMRDIFGIKPWEQGGLTEAETLNVLRDFDVYLDLVKKNGSPLPTLPNATDLPQSDPFTESAPTNAG